MQWVPGMTLESVEKIAILEAYRFYRSNKTVTAQSLGISIRTLDAKLEKYEAESQAQREGAIRAKLEAQKQLERAMKVPSQFQIQSSIPHAIMPKLNYADPMVIANEMKAKSEKK